MVRVLDIRWALAVALIAAGVPAGAQQSQSTSATFGEWIVQCASEAGPPPKKTCQMVQMTRVNGKNITFSRIAIVPAAGRRPAGMEAQFPVNVSLHAPVIVRTGEADAGFSAPFDRCLPAGCFAEFELKDEIVKRLRAAEGAGKAIFKDAGGHDVAVPMSFKGFREAFDALAKE